MQHLVLAAALALAALPVAAAHHTPDCSPLLVLVDEPGLARVAVLGDVGCAAVGVRLGLGACLDVEHDLGHDSCEYVVGAELP